MPNNIIIYIHGQGGSAGEAEHYKPLFPNSEVFGLDYRSKTPMQAKYEFPELFDCICGSNENVTLIANSIGAFFAMTALHGKPIEKACFISPIVDMERLIRDMMNRANVSEQELCEKGEIETDFGQWLSWEYLSYVRNHPICWDVPTHILYGGKDNLTSFETVCEFAEKRNATLTVMKDSEHWFHTPEQMSFLDNWIKSVK